MISYCISLESFERQSFSHQNYSYVWGEENAWERGAESLPSPLHGNQMVFFHHSHAVVLLVFNMTHRLGCWLVYFVVCFVAVSVHSETQPHKCWIQTCSGSGSWPPHGHMGMELSDSPRHENIFMGEDEPCLFGALLQIFMCSWNWFHMSWGQPASADFLIKLNREREGERQRLYWSLIE